MPFKNLVDSQIRSIAKEYIESLEYWIRTVIDRELRSEFGTNYIEAKKENGDYLLNKSIRDEINNRKKLEPNRYPRLIDACLLDTSIKILTKPDLYKKYFRKYFEKNFSLGRDFLLEILRRLIDPRNALYHANPISHRNLEQIVCYSNDIIDSIKEYYKENSMNTELNVPKVLRVTDSLGNSVFREQWNPTDKPVSAVDLIKPEFILYPGDKLKLEVEIDPSFNRNEYKIVWSSVNAIPAFGNTNSIHLDIQEKHIGEKLGLHCSVISNKVWHRHGNRDDVVIVNYKVLPIKQ